MDRVLGMLGIACRAGRVESGSFLAEKAIQGRRAYLVIAAGDAGKNTVSMLMNKCAYYHVPFRTYETMEVLGHALGKGDRSCLAVTDEGIAAKLLTLLSDGQMRESGES